MSTIYFIRKSKALFPEVEPARPLLSLGSTLSLLAYLTKLSNGERIIRRMPAMIFTASLTTKSATRFTNTWSPLKSRKSLCFTWNSA
jgi:hypothetical protein